MSKSLRIEVGIEFPVQPHQQIAVKRRRHPGRIVVGSLQNTISLFDQIDTQQQAIPGIKSRPHTFQQRQRFSGLEVPDARSDIEHQPSFVGNVASNSRSWV